MAKTATKTNAAEAAERKNDIDLAEFDYKSLTGKSFDAYVDIVGDRSVSVIDEETGKTTMGKPGRLMEKDKFWFELYKVDVVMKVRFPGVEGSPSDFVGIKVKVETPVHTTKIRVKDALTHNAQILNAHSRAGHGTYYLLKK